MLYESNLSDEQRTRLRKLAWGALAKFVVSVSAAVGTKMGEKAVEWLFGEDDEGDDEEPGA